MTHSLRRYLTLSVPLFATLAGSGVAARTAPELRYWLPMANVTATLTKTLVSCPDTSQPLTERNLVIQDKWTVEEEAAADPAGLVRIDVSSGFLAKRSNALAFYPNGTLSGFNGSSEGQGSVVINSLIKAATMIAPMLGVSPVGLNPVPPPPGTRYCSAKAIAALKGAVETEGKIRSLEDLIAAGQASPAQALALEGLKQRLAASRKKLVVKGAVTLPGGTDPWTGNLEKLDIEKAWFVASPAGSATGAVGFRLGDLKGNHAFTVKVTDIAGKVPAQGENPFDDKPQRSLVYRRPLMAQVNVAPSPCDLGACGGELLELEQPLLISQWGATEVLPVGSAGLFGSRQAAAKFDAFGTPTELSFGSESGGAAIASTIDVATGLATSLRDADTAALERQIKRLELEQKLAELQTAQSTEPSP